MIQRVNLEEKPDWVGASWGVIDAIMEGDQSIELLCKTWGMTQGTFYRMTMKHPDLKEAFGLARRIRAQRYVDQAIELTRSPTTKRMIPVQHTDPDTGDISTRWEEREVSADWDRDAQDRFTANSGLIQRDALRIKTLLHLAAKLDPEQFGDRIIEDHRGDGKAMLVIGDTAKAAALIAEARKRRLAGPDDEAEQAEAVGSTRSTGSNPALLSAGQAEQPEQPD